jgi:catechol 2,3-dioxygenase-like lactoylglutathione lyase family enzyme
MNCRLDLVTLLVEDVAASTRFYRDVLGLAVIKDKEGYVELESEGVRLALYSRVALAKLLAVPEEKLGSIDLSFRVDDADRAFEELVERGAEPLVPPRTMPWGHRVAFVRDPDGKLVEVSAMMRRSS